MASKIEHAAAVLGVISMAVDIYMKIISRNKEKELKARVDELEADIIQLKREKGWHVDDVAEKFKRK